MNIAMLLDLAADGIGDRVAVGGGDGMTYKSLRATAQLAAAELEQAGDGPLVLLVPNGWQIPVALFGAAWAGRTYAPLNYRLRNEAQRALRARARPAVVVDSDDWLSDTERLIGKPYPDDPVEPAVLLFTSGTSAEPKAVYLQHDHLLAYLLETVDFGSAGADEAVLLAVPPFHIAGVAGVLSSVYAGRRIVPMAAFEAAEWIALAQAEQVTHAFLVPTMLARIVDVMARDAAARVPSLRSLAYGGARMPAPVLERALELFPTTDFVNAYGLTETSSTIAILGPEVHAAARGGDLAAQQRLASVGQPIPGVQVRIVDDTGDDAERGALWVRGGQVTGEGWLVTGDIASRDEDGFLYLHGRSDDVIIRGGENIAPAEVEDALLRHSTVASAAVVGRPDAEWGERVEAFVVPRDGETVDPAGLVAWMRERLGTLKAPDVVHVCAELPLTATGKVLRRELRG